MRDGTGDNTWSTLAHRHGYTYDRTWADDELTFNAVELNCERNAPPTLKTNVRTKTIAFADLARDVQVHPSYTRGDGFMLTRCVQYAAANADEDYVFPDDFEYLARKLDDHRQLSAEHYDKASFKRWADPSIEQAYGDPETETFSHVAESEDETSDGSRDRFDVTHNNVLPGIPAESLTQWATFADNMAIAESFMPEYTVCQPLSSLSTIGSLVYNLNGRSYPVQQNGLPGDTGTQPTVRLNQHPAVIAAPSYDLESHLWADWDLLEVPAPELMDDFIDENFLSWFLSLEGDRSFFAADNEMLQGSRDSPEAEYDMVGQYDGMTPEGQNSHQDFDDEDNVVMADDFEYIEEQYCL